jgi:aspartate 1-decarboxylase
MTCGVIVCRFMRIHLLKSKIHRAQVTAACVDYEGSLTIAEDLMTMAGLRPYERILCSNLAHGQRFETYVIAGKPGSGAIELNGATSHLGQVGDRLTIMSFAAVEESDASRWKPRILVLGPKNAVVNKRGI